MKSYTHLKFNQTCIQILYVESSIKLTFYFSLFSQLPIKLYDVEVYIYSVKINNILHQ